MMEAKLKARDLVDSYRILLMSEDTDCGNEILCTLIAKKCAKIAVNEIIKANPIQPLSFMLESEAIDAGVEYWQEVLIEIDNI